MRQLLLAILFAFGTAIWAEEPLRETEAQTIARCLRELKSGDPEVRRRAALVVGKYNTPETQDALIRCLRDADARIRQSALVSLCEEHNVPMEAHGAVLALLKDPDVQIRRLAASLLREIILFGTPIRAGESRRTKELALAGAVNDALGDEDASVRKSALRVSIYFPEMLDARRLEAFFSSKDVELKTLALQSYAQQRVPVSQVLAKVLPLAKDASAEVRAAVVKLLSVQGATISTSPGTVTTGELAFSGALPALQKLSQDEDAGVAVEALHVFLRFDREDGTKLLLKQLSSPETPLAHKQGFLPLLHYSNYTSPDLLLTFLQDGPDALRLPAYQELITGRYGQMGKNFYLNCLALPDPMVRKLAANTVSTRLANLTLPQFTQLSANPHSDIRELAAKLVRRVPASPQRNELLLDLCADDEQIVRIAALRQLPLLRPAGWFDILTASFEDADPKIRETAAEMLCLVPRTPETIRLLTDFLPTCTNPALAQRIQRLLAPKPSTARPRTLPNQISK